MTHHCAFDDTHVDDLLQKMERFGGTELRLAAGSPPLIVDQAVRYPIASDALSQVQALRLCYDVLTDPQIAEYEAQGEVRFDYSIPRYGRFQAYYRRTEGGLEATFRRSPNDDGLCVVQHSN